jgi:hypothetical protein
MLRTVSKGICEPKPLRSSAPNRFAKAQEAIFRREAGSRCQEAKSGRIGIKKTKELFLFSEIRKIGETLTTTKPVLSQFPSKALLFTETKRLTCHSSIS